MTSTSAMLAPIDQASDNVLVRFDQFGDPGCPWDFGAESVRLRLAWHYGDQLAATFRMIVLSEKPSDYEAKGFTTEMQVKVYTKVRAIVGMPISTEQRERMHATLPACLAVVGVRRHRPKLTQRFLRELRIETMTSVSGLLDNDTTTKAAATRAGLDAAQVLQWRDEPETEKELRLDMEAARHPLPAATPQDHNMVSWPGGRRYTAPTFVMRGASGPGFVAVGSQPFETYDVLIANIAPTIKRRGPAESAREVLEWAKMPVSSREVAAIRGISDDEARAELSGVGASFSEVSNDGWWSL